MAAGSPPLRVGTILVSQLRRRSYGTHSSLRCTTKTSNARTSTQAARTKAKIRASPGGFFGTTPTVRPGLLRRIAPVQPVTLQGPEQHHRVDRRADDQHEAPGFVPTRHTTGVSKRGAGFP